MSDDVYLYAESGASSGIKIRPIRAFVGLPALADFLKEKMNFPKVRSFNYGVRVYQISPDKAPKKITESMLLKMIAPNLGLQGTDGKSLSSRSYVNAGLLSYGELQKMQDGAVVWVLYRHPETGEKLINAPHVIRRSHGHSTKTVPAWKLTDLLDPKGEELFIQGRASRASFCACVDDEQMTLLKAVLPA